MSVSVRDILKCNSLKRAAVITGKDGLDRRISSVTVGEVPDIADWLRGNEVVLSTFFATCDDDVAQADFAKKIMNSGAAALMIKPKRFIGKLSPKITSIANKARFPIIEVPPEIRWTEIIREIYEMIVGRHAALLERSAQIHQELLKIIIEGEGWQSIADCAERLIGRPIVLEDRFLKTLAKSEATGKNEFIDGLDIEEVMSHLQDFQAGQRCLRIPCSSKARFPTKVMVPIVVEHDTLGYVSTIESKQEINELDLIALEHTAGVAAIEMGRERVRMETEIRLKGDFVDELISGEFESEEAVLKRAKFLDCDLSNGAVILMAAIDDPKSFILKNELSEQRAQRTKRELFDYVSAIVRQEHADSLVTLKGSKIVVFLTPGRTCKKDRLASKAKDLAGRLGSLCGQRFGDFTVSIGIGRFHSSCSELAAAYEEAKVAIEVTQKLGKQSTVTTFDQIGVYKLLADLLKNNPRELSDLYTETIAPLVFYDEQHETELVKTLSHYLRNNRNLNLTAQELFSHRHTIRYRLKRVGELTGLDVYETEDLEKLSLGLKSARLLNPEGR